MVRLPDDATDQIRHAPVGALRAVFSGVGRLLLAADRLREEDAGQELESGDDQPGSWDGRLSSSVRLIKPSGTTATSSRDAGASPSAKPEPPAGKSGPRGRKPEPAGKARAADSARAGRPGKAAKQPTRGGKNVADAKRTTKTKAGNGGNRKSGRSREIVEPPRFRSLDLTGNVRMLTDQDMADLATEHLTTSTAGAQPGGPTASVQAGPVQAASVQAGPVQAASVQAGSVQAGPVQAGPVQAGMVPAGMVPEIVPAAPTAPVWSDAAPAWSSWSTDRAPTPESAPPVANLPISGYDELSLPSLRARLRNLDPTELADLLAHERSHANRDDVVTMFERRIAKLADGT